MKTATTFLRTEKKYVLTKDQARRILSGMDGHIQPDGYPEYDLFNIYFDTDDNLIASRCLEKTRYKEKCRLRSYGPVKDGDPVFFEIKRKYDGLGEKRRIVTTQRQAMRAVRNGTFVDSSSQIRREVNYFLSRYDLKPYMFIAYHRQAFTGKDESDLRITFDTELRYRTKDLSLRETGAEIPFTGEDMVIMEIKAREAFPLWLTRILAREKALPSSFSKYTKIYTRIQALRNDPAGDESRSAT